MWFLGQWLSILMYWINHYNSCESQWTLHSLTASSLAGVDASFSDQAFVNMATSAPDKVAAMPSQATNTSIPSWEKDTESDHIWRSSEPTYLSQRSPCHYSKHVPYKRYLVYQTHKQRYRTPAIDHQLHISLLQTNPWWVQGRHHRDMAGLQLLCSQFVASGKLCWVNLCLAALNDRVGLNGKGRWSGLEQSTR